MARYLTDYLAIGMNGRYWASGSPPAAPSAALWPLQKKTWSADVDFTYVPLSSARRAGGRPVVPVDGYLVVGAGVIATGPVPVVDPTRTLEPTVKVDGVVGAGGRLFLTPFLALSVEVRDAIYSDRLENPILGPSPRDPADWYGPSRIVHDVQAGLGLSFWLPTTVTPYL